MSGFLTAVLSVGVILGFMILIHEFGHYAVAKLLGVRVEATPTIASLPSRSAAT